VPQIAFIRHNLVIPARPNLSLCRRPNFFKTQALNFTLCRIQNILSPYGFAKFSISDLIGKRVYCVDGPKPVAARYKASVSGRSLAGIAGLNPAGDTRRCLPLLHSVCCQVEVSASDCSLVQRISAECDREASTMRMPRH